MSSQYCCHKSSFSEINLVNLLCVFTENMMHSLDSCIVTNETKGNPLCWSCILKIRCNFAALDAGFW